MLMPTIENNELLKYHHYRDNSSWLIVTANMCDAVILLLSILRVLLKSSKSRFLSYVLTNSSPWGARYHPIALLPFPIIFSSVLDHSQSFPSVVSGVCDEGLISRFMS